jgi:hypothetical protein
MRSDIEREKKGDPMRKRKGKEIREEEILFNKESVIYIEGERRKDHLEQRARERDLQFRDVYQIAERVAMKKRKERG